MSTEPGLGVFKRVRSQEWRMTQMAAELGVGAPILWSHRHLDAVALLDYEIETEYRGETLLLVLQRRGVDRHSLHRQTLEQVNKLHENGIFHGDLSEENVLYSPQHGITIIDYEFSAKQGEFDYRRAALDLYDEPGVDTFSALCRVERNEIDFIFEL